MKTFRSYDVFDTALVRAVADPHAVFHFVAMKGATAGHLRMHPSLWKRLRVKAERIARSRAAGGEPTLKGIYSVVREISDLNARDVDALMSIEIETEHALIRPVPSIRDRILLSRYKEDEECIFISDMYLSSSIITEFLCNAGCGPGRVFVSCEHAASKAGGGLFVEVGALLVGSGEWRTHCGDNLHADVTMASKAGISAEHFNAAHPNRREIILESFSEETEGMTSLIAGASRLTRLDDPAKGWRGTEVVTSVAAPFIALYCFWILEQASRSGIKSLFFVSRDGYIPHLFCRELSTAHYPEIECRYLYGSRQAWRMPTIDPDHLDVGHWIFEINDGTTIFSMLERAGVSRTDLEEVLDPKTYEEFAAQVSQPLTSQAIELLLNLIRKDPLRSLIADKVRNQKSLLESYMREQGVLGRCDVGFVELGWKGRTRHALELSLGPGLLDRAHWFYLGLEESLSPEIKERIHVFLEDHPSTVNRIPDLHEIAESFCIADHPSVSGYRLGVERVEPSFQKGNERELDEFGRSEMISVYHRWISRLMDTKTFHSPGFWGKDVAHDLMSGFCRNPSIEEAIAWGSFPFEQDQALGRSLHLAQRVTLNIGTALDALRFGDSLRVGKGGRISGWGGGSWALGGPERLIIRLLCAVGRLRHRIRRKLRAFCDQQSQTYES